MSMSWNCDTRGDRVTYIPVLMLLKAASGKQNLSFNARIDHYEMQ